MEYSQKVAVLAQEVMEELANLSKQKKPLTAEFLQEALEKRNGVALLLENENGKAEEVAAAGGDIPISPVQPPTEPEKPAARFAAPSGGGHTEAVIEALRRTGVFLAVAAKQEQNDEVNDCLDRIKAELKQDDTDPDRLKSLLDALRNARHRAETPDITPPISVPTRAQGIEIAETEPAGRESDRIRGRVEYLVERLRAVMERVIGQLSLPENQMFSERLSAVSKKLNQDPSLPELEVLEQQVYELVVAFRQEIEKERDTTTSLLLDVARELVETEKEFLWTLLTDRKRKREGDIQVEETIRKRVQAIEGSLTKETDVTRLREVVKNGMNGIRQYIADWRKRQENVTQASEVKIAGLRSRLKKSNEELDTIQRKAEEDPLTGVMNRRALERHLERIVEECRQSELWASFIMLDIDHFKDINDTYGHLNGDKVLAAMCRTISGSLRQDDLFFRYGGDEFSIVLPGTHTGDARAVAEKIRGLVKRLEFISKGSRVPVSISLGVTELRPDDTAETMVQRADEALYCAKEKGRNRVEVKD